MESLNTLFDLILDFVRSYIDVIKKMIAEFKSGNLLATTDESASE